MTAATATTLTYSNATVSAGATGTITLTDTYAGLFCQTPQASQATYNPYLATQLGQPLGFDILINNTGVPDTSQNNYWLCNGTASYMTVDGLHPSFTGAENMAINMRAARVGLT